MGSVFCLSFLLDNIVPCCSSTTEFSIDYLSASGVWQLSFSAYLSDIWVFSSFNLFDWASYYIRLEFSLIAGPGLLSCTHSYSSFNIGKVF